MHTLGCKVNWCDSENIAAYVEKAGWQRVGKISEAQICIVNTCTVTKHADASARKIIRQIHRKNPESYIIVTGCYAKTDSDIISKIEEVDEIVMPDDNKNLLNKMNSAVERLKSDSEQQKEKVEKPFLRTRIFIKVQDGCNQFCSYCKVPFARGRSRSISENEILEKIKTIEKKGVKEVVITGIHLAAYNDNNKNIADLLQKIAEKTSVQRIRIGSLESNAVTKKLCELFKKYPSIMPNLHIPLQSGSDKILELMNRPARISDFNRAVDLFLNSHPLAAVSTDVLVGLPGETEEDFNATVEIIEKIPFLKAHVFQFSPRPGTAAAKMEKLFVQPSEIKRREKILIEKAEVSALLCRKQFKNAKLKVLIEEKKNGFWEGFSENYLRIKTKADFGCEGSSKSRSGRSAVEQNSIVTLDMSDPENMWG